MMRTIGGLNCPAGRLDGQSSGGHGEAYVEKIPYTQALGAAPVHAMAEEPTGWRSWCRADQHLEGRFP
jgi:hypothetical protein